MPKKSAGPDERAMREIDQAVGHQIRGLREKRGLSQADLGALIGVTYQQVQKYERGETSVTAARLVLLRSALKVPVADLFPGNGDMPELPLSIPAIELGKRFDQIDDSDCRDAMLVLAHAFTKIRSNGQ